MSIAFTAQSLMISHDILNTALQSKKLSMAIGTSMIDEDLRRHLIKHVEDTLKPKEDLTEKLSPIEEESEDSEIERDEIEESDKSVNDSELYAGQCR